MKKNYTRNILTAIFVVGALATAITVVAMDITTIGTLWAMLPPLVAIGLALITKEVYSSPSFGVVIGAILACSGYPAPAVNYVVNDGLIAAISGTAGIFLFLVILGTIVALINKSGASAAFGRWAKTHIKSRVGAQLAAFVLGVLIFIDDYFNCLTVGSVMKPVTDAHRVSRAKFSYIIDATAAPICMIAPISSWAAAVASYTEGTSIEGQGFEYFIKAIPYNFYSILTIVFVVAIIIFKADFGPMRRHELNAINNGDLFSTDERVETTQSETNPRGRVIDLILPIIVLVGISVVGLIYMGGFFTPGDAKGNFVDSFANTDATVGLPWGALIALIFVIGYMLVRKLITFKGAMECVPLGFKAMVPAITILTLATALKNISNGLLNASGYVDQLMKSEAAQNMASFLPAVIFVIACVLAFATGTSWGTFGILIPIVCTMFKVGDPMLVICMSASLAGAVCGDHCSPISDTTIMSSAGAECVHVNHVSTQLPYAITVAAISFTCYIVAGFVPNAYVCLGIGVALIFAFLTFVRVMNKKKEAKN